MAWGQIMISDYSSLNIR